MISLQQRQLRWLQVLQQQLQLGGGKVGQLAKRVGMERTHLYRKLRSLGIDISHTADASVHVDVAEMSDLKVRMHGNIAVVTGAYYERGKSNGKPYEYRDRLTDVWMKVGNKWQVIASHYSVPLK